MSIDVHPLCRCLGESSSCQPEIGKEAAAANFDNVFTGGLRRRTTNVRAFGSPG
jgi:hypothetical protein